MGETEPKVPTGESQRATEIAKKVEIVAQSLSETVKLAHDLYEKVKVKVDTKGNDSILQTMAPRFIDAAESIIRNTP